MNLLLFLIGPLWTVPCAAMDEYEFVPDTKRFVGVFHGDTYSIGRLDAAGNYFPDPRWINLDLHTGYSAGFPPRSVINSPKGGAYEYRSGRLIPGELRENGNFMVFCARCTGGRSLKPDKALRLGGRPRRNPLSRLTFRPPRNDPGTLPATSPRTAVAG